MEAEPRHRRLANELRTAIRGGTYSAGERLPTEQRLSEQYEMSRTTVRKALSQLHREGLITATAGSGTYVRTDRPVLVHHAATAERPGRLGDGDSWHAEIRAAGHEPSQDFSMHTEPASDSIAMLLRLEAGAMVVVRRCERWVDGQPWGDQVAYYPLDVAKQAGLDVPHDLPQGTARAMADAGIEEVLWADRVATRVPWPEEAEKWELEGGIPLLIVTRVAWTIGRPVCVVVTTSIGDRTEWEYVIGAPAARD